MNPCWKVGTVTMQKLFTFALALGLFAAPIFGQDPPKTDPTPAPVVAPPAAQDPAPTPVAPPVAPPQDPPPIAPGQEKVEFKFKDVPIDVVLQYVSRVTGLVIVNEDRVSGKVDAYSETALTQDQILVFLDSILSTKGFASVRVDRTVKIVTLDKAKKIQDQPYKKRADEPMSPTDKVVMVVMPLKNLNVAQVKKELEPLFPSELQISMNSHSNSFIFTGRERDIYRIKNLLAILDIQANEDMQVRVFQLKNADCNQMTKMITDLFIKKGDNEQPDPMGFRGMMQMMSRRNRDGGGDFEPKTLAAEIVRVVADERTNSVVVASISDNVKVIEEIVKSLDADTPPATRLKSYHLYNADATAVAKLVNDVFEPKQDPAAAAAQSMQQQRMRNMMFFGGGGGSPSSGDPASATSIKAIADVRTNAVIIAAGEKQHEVIGQIIEDLDRQVTDILQIRRFPLVNADAAETVATIKEMFKSQAAQTTTAAGGRNQPGGGRGGFTPTQSSGSSSLPNMVVEVTADVRTNSVVAKASSENLGMIGQLIDELDKDPTEKETTYVYRLKHANAQNTADTIKGMITGQSVRRQQNANQQNPFSAFGTNAQNAFSSSNQNSSRAGGNTRRGQLGPFDQDPFQDPTQVPPEEDPTQQGPAPTFRGGTVSIEPDPDTNTLVIRTSPRNYAAIQSILMELDRPRPQVLIKVMIADMLVEDALALGAEGNWKQDISDADELAMATDFEELDPARVGAGAFTATYTGRDGTTLRFQAMAREGRAKILATPEILVLDNQTAKITVGRNVPFIENSQQTPQGGTLNTIRYDDVGIMLQVAPHINPDGIVTMTVNPEVSDIDPTRSVPISEGVTSPTFTTNSAFTTVSVRNGQTVVIGGLIRDQTEKVRQSLPILGDIPLLGALFGRTDEVTQQREMVIFLTPYVVYSQPQLEELSRVERASLRLFSPTDLPNEGRRWRGMMWK